MTYPKWQAGIRSAQLRKRELETIQREADEKKALEWRNKRRPEFHEFLRKAGIDVGVKDIVFVGDHPYGGDPRVEFGDYELTYLDRPGAATILSIAKRLPVDEEALTLDPDGEYGYIQTVWESVMVSQGQVEAWQIADAIDAIEERIPIVLACNTALLDRLRAAQNAPKPESLQAIEHILIHVPEPLSHDNLMHAHKFLDAKLNEYHSNGYRVVSIGGTPTLLLVLLERVES